MEQRRLSTPARPLRVRPTQHWSHLRSIPPPAPAAAAAAAAAAAPIPVAEATTTANDQRAPRFAAREKHCSTSPKPLQLRPRPKHHARRSLPLDTRSLFSKVPSTNSSPLATGSQKQQRSCQSLGTSSANQTRRRSAENQVKGKPTSRSVGLSAGGRSGPGTPHCHALTAAASSSSVLVPGPFPAARAILSQQGHACNDSPAALEATRSSPCPDRPLSANVQGELDALHDETAALIAAQAALEAQFQVHAAQVDELASVVSAFSSAVGSEASLPASRHWVSSDFGSPTDNVKKPTSSPAPAPALAPASAPRELGAESTEFRRDPPRPQREELASWSFPYPLDPVAEHAAPRNRWRSPPNPAPDPRLPWAMPRELTAEPQAPRPPQPESHAGDMYGHRSSASLARSLDLVGAALQQVQSAIHGDTSAGPEALQYTASDHSGSWCPNNGSEESDEDRA